MIDVNLLYDAKLLGWQRSSVIYSLPKTETRGKSKGLAWIALVLWFFAFGFLVVPTAPKLLYSAFPDMTAAVAASLGTTADVEKSEFGESLYEEPVTVLPPKNPALPEENMLIIDKIGFSSEIGEGEDWEEVLKDGPWRVPSFGTPEDDSSAIIMASHRFGYLTWTNQFRRENSFYNLPKLENGDTFRIIWNQREYVYEVYEGYTDTGIRDDSYGADVILYTCEVLNSDRRIFRLARRVDSGENLTGFGLEIARRTRG